MNRKRTPEVNFLVQHLRDCAKKGDMATYVDMAKLVNCDAADLLGGGSKRHWLDSAIKVCEKDHDLLFTCEIAIGYVVIEDRYKPGKISARFIAKSQSNNRRCRSQLRTVDESRLSEAGKKELRAAEAKLMVAEFAVSEKVQGQIAAQIQSMSRQQALNDAAARKAMIQSLLEMGVG